MYIKELMNRHVITIHEETAFTTACRLFSEFKIHHLPVVDEKGKPVGVFSANDALKAYNDKIYNRLFTSEQEVNDLIKVADLISYQVYYLRPTDTIEQAILLFKEFDIHSIPVLENNQLTGIITSSDILAKIKDVETT